MNTTLKRLFIVLLLCPMISFAQQTHTVGAKETLFSIGRQYNVHPRELATYNKIPFETGLTIGQVLKIPAQKTMTPVPADNTANNKTENNTTSNTETNNSNSTVEVKTQAQKNLVPVYHTVLKKENLFQIRMKYNKVSIDSIKKWNSLENESLSEGMKLIVGYENGTDNKSNSSFDKYPVSNNSSSDFKTDRANKLEKDETPSYSNITPTSGPKVTAEGGGYFRGAFVSQSANKNNGVEEEGKAAAFKSTSGWDDGKYYCLHNTAPSGTIVKITNKLNQKVIYAKVLDVIPDISQNKGIFLRLSKAGAEELGVTEEQFDAIVAY
jgi:LysM repeat protein